MLKSRQFKRSFIKGSSYFIEAEDWQKKSENENAIDKIYLGE